MIDGHTNFGWEVLCEELLELRVSRKIGAVVPLRKVANGDAAGNGVAKASIFNELEAEKKGFENAYFLGRSRDHGGNGGNASATADAPSREITRVPGGVPDDVTRVTLERAREAVRVLREGGHSDLAEAVDRLTRPS